MSERSVIYRISEMPSDERPRERLAHLGAQSLSTAELLAILLRTGVTGENVVSVGQRLLRDFGGLAGLRRASIEELCAQRGVGLAKAAQLKAAVELAVRFRETAPDERQTIHSPADAAEHLQYEMELLEQEELRAMLLDTRNRIIKVENVYKGSINQSQVRVAELFKGAIRANAASVIIAHNHPSGDPTPSPDDVAVTRQMIQAGKLLDIEVLDHLVIGRGRFVSLKDRGLGF